MSHSLQSAPGALKDPSMEIQFPEVHPLDGHSQEVQAVTTWASQSSIAHSKALAQTEQSSDSLPFSNESLQTKFGQPDQHANE
eukprot:1681200-Amphidinium_carterae.1